tara:strand:- start:2913 stop:3089 length:177 start_codon:yes stop_codon:yes gene_type:complete
VPKRLTKTQVKRLYRDILSKSRKLWEQNAVLPYTGIMMTTPDYMAIEKIIHKYQKKMR